MLAAIMAGLNGLGTSPPVACSANCTWAAPAISLGFSAECKDVTKEVLEQKTCAMAKDDKEYPISQLCNMTTPGGVPLKTSFDQDHYETTVVVNAVDMARLVNKSAANGTMLWPAELVKVGIWRLKPAWVNDGKDDQIPDEFQEVYECSLAVAAWDYTGSFFRSGNLTESRVLIPLNDTWINDFDDETVTFKIKEGHEHRDFSVEMVVSLADLRAINDFFMNDPVSGNLTSGTRVSWNLFGVRPGLLTGNVTENFELAASGLTNFVRASNGSTAAVGETRRHVPWVEVRWQFLVGPMFVLLGAIGLLVLTVAQNPDELDAWKDEILPVILASYSRKDGIMYAPLHDVRSAQLAYKGAFSRA
jgi:hypothetical protein